MSRASNYHRSDSRGYQGSRFSQCIASSTAAARTTAYRAVTNPRSDRTNTPCLGRVSQWPCSSVSLDLLDNDMSTEIKYFDLQKQGSMFRKRLKESDFRLGIGPRSEEDFQRLLTNFVTFTHALLKINVQRKCLLYSRSLSLGRF
jgi:hypothetical protein